VIAALLLSVITVHVDTSHPVNRIRPLEAIGTSVDSDPPGKIPMLYSPSRVKAILASGLGTLTVRLYTELSIQDWHWNPNGTFSDAKDQEGYWTSSAVPSSTPIVDSYAYNLPHRGDTQDQGDNDGYSRIDDGDPSTYWKSNPYLTHLYTHEPDAVHPQWVVIDLGAVKPVDAIAIGWVDPYATRYRVEYWAGTGDAILDEGNGRWVPFPQSNVSNAHSGTVQTRLSDTPMRVRWVRVLMSASSNTCDSHGASDQRNCVGYAIGDIGLGTVDGAGKLDNLVVESTCGGDPASTRGSCTNHQTMMWTSSVDPWHAASDKTKADQDQPGLDIVSTSGITRGLPTIYPVPVIYSTPQNAANEVRYLEARHFPIAYIEMGEEVDGQYWQPEDYAELFLQFARAIHRVDPKVKVGGPIFEGFNVDWRAWRDAQGQSSWLGRFVDYLRKKNDLGDLQFMSFEHYPFHACDDGDQLQDDLLREASMIKYMVRIFRADGVPANVPMLVTESNFSADGASLPQRVEGALWVADYMASGLSSGLSYVTYYQAEPEPIGHNSRCDRYGAYNPFIVDDSYTIRARGAAYYAAQMLTQEWLQPGLTPQSLYATTTTLGDERPLVTAYAARLPNGEWSILLDNKDFQARTVRIPGLGSAVHYATFGEGEYQWSARDPETLPSPDSGISHASLHLSGDEYRLPPRSISVIRLH
jgi:hypothetical protein